MSEIIHPQAPINPLVEKLEEVGHKEFARMVDRGEIPSLTAQVVDSVKYDFIQQQLNLIPEDEMVKMHVPIRDPKTGAIQRDEGGFALSEEKTVFRRDQLLQRLLRDQGLDMSDWKEWEKRSAKRSAKRSS